jgi:RNA-directed DNA polymerase
MSLQYIMNPNGGMLLQRVVEGIPSGDNLLEQIFSTENVHTAWKRVRANKGAAGIDNIKVTEFPDMYRPKWGEIKQSLM